MFSDTISLSRLGWRPFYSQQLTLDELEQGVPARVAAVQRNVLPRRLENYFKLAREAQRAALSRWRLHQESRRAGRLARAAQKHRRRDRNRD